jgi:antitoxin component YwqK of YwqJK toxin-antitoxin module
MKKIIIFFFAISLSLLVAEDDQVAIKSLQKRGFAHNQLYYLPNQDMPFTGKAVAKWPNGQKKTEINYKDGKRDGLKAHWFENGQKLSEISYKAGKHDGALTMYYENGKLRRKGNHMDGKMVGIWTHWYDNSQQMDEMFYIGGRMESAIVWRPDGKKCSFTDVKAGNGIMVKYTDSGTEWLRLTYKDGGMTHWARL